MTTNQTTINNSNSPGDYITRPAQAYIYLKIIPLLFASLLLAIASIYVHPAVAFISIGTIAITTYRYLYISRIRYSITNEQIIVEEGVFSTRKEYTEMYRIRDFSYTQSFFLKLFGVHNIVLYTFDETQAIITLTGISEEWLLDTIRNHVQSSRIRNKILTVDR